MAGGSLPPMRELSQRHAVSLAIVHAAVRSLQDEGLVTSAQGVGTQIVTRRFLEDEVFLYVRLGEDTDQAFLGMTDRLAERGAFTVLVPGLEALQYMVASKVRCRGLFGTLFDHAESRRIHPRLPFPTVSFGEHADPEVDDRVDFDDRGAGREATHHLIHLGHRDIVFVGSMGDRGHWSRLRELGYRDALGEVGLGGNERSVGWKVGTDYKVAVPQVVQDLARQLPEAVVAANDWIALEFLEALLEQRVPLANWPAIIGFDEVGVFRGQPIASMRRDGREVGRAAADLLWERCHGALSGPPTTRVLPMQLVPRMTSQRGWAFRLQRLIGAFP